MKDIDEAIQHCDMDKKLTNRQAIGVLDGLWPNPLFGEAHRQAFEIGIKAIKALEQEPSSDMVSRGAFEQVMWERDVAIEQLHELGYELGEKIHTTTTSGEGVVVMYYPQVEGVTPTVVSTGKQEPCEDAISRQEAVEAFQMFREYESNRSNKGWVDRIETVLNQLPPVTPEPKTGYWIGWGKDMTDESYKCSECGELSPYDYDFCPHCGIKNGKCTHYEDEYMEASE